MLPFDMPAATALNAARLVHLAGLGLDLASKRVYEPGCGIGLLTGFWEERGCSVVSSEGWQENVTEHLRRYPHRQGRVFWRDVMIHDAAEFSPCDILFCYGLFYHVPDPAGALQNMAQCQAPLVLLEGIVLDTEQATRQLVPTAARADSGIADQEARPSLNYLAAALRLAGWPHVYAPVDPPAHHDYLWTPLHDGHWERGGHNLRAVRVGSTTPLDLPTLREVP